MWSPSPCRPRDPNEFGMSVAPRNQGARPRSRQGSGVNVACLHRFDEASDAVPPLVVGPFVNPSALGPQRPYKLSF